MAKEEPINVQVATVLGWGYDPKHQELYSRPGQYPWRDPDGSWVMTHPDYLHDKAWLWDVVEKNKLSVRYLRDACLWCAETHPATSIICADPAEAVCRWVIAAKAAGVGVKQ